jgi:hypothetical protein
VVLLKGPWDSSPTAATTTAEPMIHHEARSTAHERRWKAMLSAIG